jgi:hypothetical protein
LTPLYTGPFVIKKQLRNSDEGLFSNPQIVNYSLLELSTNNTKDFLKIPTNRLKLKEHVEKVLDSRRSSEGNGETEYLVQTESGHQYWFSEELVPKDLLDSEFDTEWVEDPEDDGDMENEGIGSDYNPESSERNSDMEI